MSRPRHLDPFTENIARRIDPKVRDSLTPAQWDAIVQAIQTHDPEDHVVDIRTGIPLFLSRFHLVLLVLRDRRTSIQRVEESRGKQVSWLGGIFVVLLMAAPFVLLLFFFLYLLKLVLGLDVFPEFHLWDVFR